MGCYVRIAVMLVLPATILFLTAGRWDLPFFWAYVGAQVFLAVVMLCGIDRELLAERAKPAPGGIDRHLRAAAAPLMIGHWALAGFDVGRWHMTDTVPAWIQVAGIVAFVFGMAVSAWAIRVNAFFSPVVRIQSERGHHIITDGPYRFVRHPGYLGSMTALPFGGLALGSWVALFPMVVMLLLVIRRILLEDRYLHENLPGYKTYAQRVRYRIIPGIW